MAKNLPPGDGDDLTVPRLPAVPQRPAPAPPPRSLAPQRSAPPLRSAPPQRLVPPQRPSVTPRAPVQRPSATQRPAGSKRPSQRPSAPDRASVARAAAVDATVLDVTQRLPPPPPAPSPHSRAPAPPRRSAAPGSAPVHGSPATVSASNSAAATPAAGLSPPAPPSPPQRKAEAKASSPPNTGLTLLPSAPAVDGSDSIHPEAYGRVAQAALEPSPGLTDREGVSRELIALCERELSKVTDPGRKARLHYECARLYEFPLGDLEAALEHYQKARAIRGLHVPTISGLRRVHMLRGDWQAALRVISEEIDLAESPEQRGGLLFERALLLETQLRRPNDARESYEAALEQLPGDAAVLRALARARRRDGEHSALQQTLEAQANLAAPDPALLAARLAERARDVERHAAKPELSAELYQRAALTDPTASAALLHAVRLFAQEERFSEVVALERRRVELLSEPRLRAASLSATADLLSEQLGDVTSAIELLEQAAETVPKDPIPLERLARLYERIGAHEARARTLERLFAGTQLPELKLELCLKLSDLHRSRRRDVAAASRWLQAARQIDPSSTVILDGLAELCREQGDFTSLVAVLTLRERAADDVDVRAQLLLELSELHERELGDIDQAIIHQKAVLSLCPDHAVAFRGLARLLRLKYRFAELVELHERAVDLAVDEADAISHLLEMALIHEDLLQSPGAALAVFRRVLERDPKHLTALRGAQRLAEVTGEPALAVELIEREIKLTRGDARKVQLILRAAELSERQLGDEARALSFLLDVLSFEPNNRAALTAIARIHRRAGRYNDLAQTLLQEAPTLSGPVARGAHLLAVARIVEEQLGDRERALEYYRAAHDQDPSSAEAAYALERALSEAGHFDEVAMLIEQRLPGLKDLRERYRWAMELARVRETRLGADARALEAFDLALEADPESLAAVFGRMRCLGRLGKFAELVKETDRLHQLTQDPAPRLWGLLLAAELLEGELEQPAQAILRYEQVLALVPNHRGALLALERLYLSQKRHDDLVRVLQLQAHAFGAPDEQVASLRELARLESSGDDAEARRQAALVKILMQAPEDMRALLRLELCYLASRNAKGLAEVDLRWVQRAAPGVERAAHRTRLAEYLEAVNPIRARDEHRPALEEDAENIASARALTRLAEVVGDVESMREAAETEYSVVRCPERAAALLRNAARHAYGAGKSEETADILARALTLEPDDAESAAALQGVLMGLGQHDKLISVLTTAAMAAQDPEVRAGHWISVARLMAGVRGDVGAGIAALSRIALAQPGHPGILLELAELYIRDRQWGPAAERLNKALQADLDLESTVAARLRLAELYHEHLERTADAAGLLRQIVSEVPDEPRALRRLLAIEIDASDAGAEATAQLWVQRSTGPERAEALTTLGRLQRDAGKLDEAKQTLAEAVAIAGLSKTGADRDLVRILEKQEQLGGPVDWSIYAAALSNFCSGEASVDAKTNALVEASSVLIDRIGDSERGFAALRAGLSLKPQDFALQEELVRRLVQANHFERAVPELYKLLELRPARPQTWADLHQAFAAIGKSAESQLALGPLVTLGGGTDLQRATWGSRHSRSSAVAEGSVNDAVLQCAAGVSLPDGVRALLTQLGQLAPKVVEAGSERYGLSPRDRIGQKVGHPMRALLDRVARVLALDELELYAGAGDSGVDVVLGDAPGIVLPETFATLPEPQQIFCLARQLARVAMGMPVEAALGTEQTLMLMGAAATAVGIEPPASVAGADIDGLGRRLVKAVPWLSKGRFEDAVRRSAADQPADLGATFRALNRGALRLALVVSDDLGCLGLLKAKGPRLFGIEAQSLGATLEDLLKFWISPDAMAIRRQIGLL